MLWLLYALIGGLVAAGVMSTLVFRVHDEFRWMKPKKACIKCELPRKPHELIPFFGDAIVRARCKSCSAYYPWQYPLIELVILALTIFHAWRYAAGVWVPIEADTVLWLWALRDCLFSYFLVAIFVYDLKYALILDRITIPAMAVALGLNIYLGYSGYELVFTMTLLFLFFLVQYLFSKGSLLGAGDVRMGLVMGSMLGFVDGISSLLIAYVIGAVVAVILVSSGSHTMHDRVPFGTFLSVGIFLMLVWGDLFLSAIL